MKTVSINDFLKALENNAVAFDVRTEVEYEIDGLEGVKHLSLEVIQREHYPPVAKDKAIYLICEYGHLSELAGLYLEAAGFDQVYIVEGGMQAWRKQRSS